MQKYFNNVADQNGNAISGANVSVAKNPGPTVIYSDNGVTPIVGNFLTTDANGYFAFYAPDGRYNISITATGITPQSITDILLEDSPSSFSQPTGSSLVGFIQSGTGAVARTVQDKVRDFVSAKDYGAVEDGVTNDAVAVQAALTANPGRIVRFNNKIHLAASITLPSGSTLSGPLSNVGEVSGKNYNVTGTILLDSGATINVGDYATVTSCYVLNNALASSLPFASGAAATAAVSAFAGTAITATGQDAQVRDVWIGGFAQAFSSTGRERTKLQRVEIDCTNGVLIDNSTDIGRLMDVHCWPFITTHQGYTTNTINARSGSAFKLTTESDTFFFTNCFDYGWAIGFDIQSKEQVDLVNCFSDGGSLGIGQIGFKFTNTADLIRVVGGGSSGKSQGAYLNTLVAAVNGAVHFTGTTFWGNPNHITSDQHRILSIQDCEFRDNNASPNTAVTISSTVTGKTKINDNTFDTCGTALLIDPSSSGALIVGNLFNAVSTTISISGTAFEKSYITDNNYIACTDSLGPRRLYDAQVALNYETTYGTVTSGYTLISRLSRGSPGSPTISQSGDQPWRLFARIYDGAAFQNVGSMRFETDGTPAAGSTPGKLVLATTPSASGNPTDRTVLDSLGNITNTGNIISSVGFLKGSPANGIIANPGGGIGSATPITAQFTAIGTVANAGDSVILPAATSGNFLCIANRGANACQVFAPGSDQINGTAGSTGISLASNKQAFFFSTVVNRWWFILTA